MIRGSYLKSLRSVAGVTLTTSDYPNSLTKYILFLCLIRFVLSVTWLNPTEKCFKSQVAAEIWSLTRAIRELRRGILEVPSIVGRVRHTSQWDTKYGVRGLEFV